MESILKYKKYIIYSVICIVLIGIITIFYLNKENKTRTITNNVLEKKEEKKLKQEEKKEDIITQPKEVFVDVKGAVINPGVYKLSENKIVNDAINMAGGLNKYSDTKCINLSKKIKDEMVIYVYTKTETYELLKKEKNESKNIENVCKDVKNNAIVTYDNSKSQETKNENTTSNISKIININTADIEGLSNLPGIGEAKAKIIIDYRNTNGNFKNIEELKNVKGIGEATFEKIKSLITI